MQPSLSNDEPRCTVCRVDSRQPAADAIAAAAAVLRSGGLVAFPTETVYGLGADASCETAVLNIFKAKGRPAHNPVIVHVADSEQARRAFDEWSFHAEKLAETFWPGPLTLVQRKAAWVPAAVTAGGPTVAIRIPEHPVALALIEAAALPIAAPSANRSNQISPTTAHHVLKGLENKIDMLLDAGPTSGGVESTVVDLTSDPPRLLRPGLITREQIEAVIQCSLADPAKSQHDILRSPGQLSRHYAPQATLEIRQEGWQRVQEHLKAGCKVGWLRSSSESLPAEISTLSSLHIISMPPAALAYSARLYAALHECDEFGADRIVVDSPPEESAWAAVADRLNRAAT